MNEILKEVLDGIEINKDLSKGPFFIDDCDTLPKLFNHVDPDFVFYLSGVDILATDRLGRLGMSIEGCRQRDEQVLEFCYKHSLPVQCSMGGGYSQDIKLIIEAHANTFRVAQYIF